MKRLIWGAVLTALISTNAWATKLSWADNTIQGVVGQTVTATLMVSEMPTGWRCALVGTRLMWENADPDGPWPGNYKNASEPFCTPPLQDCDLECLAFTKYNETGVTNLIGGSTTFTRLCGSLDNQYHQTWWWTYPWSWQHTIANETQFLQVHFKLLGYGNHTVKWGHHNANCPPGAWCGAVTEINVVTINEALEVQEYGFHEYAPENILPLDLGPALLLTASNGGGCKPGEAWNPAIEQCEVKPALPATWSRVKALYE